ncbi:MAG TPA: RraA family protein [Bryobacteraceae bacterium]|nr:RraA family protein [Bryobacteraceae bacterium]
MSAPESRQPMEKTPTEIITMEAICERYKRLYAGAVYDVLEGLGYPDQALSHHLVALTPGMKLAGPAFTVKGTVTGERDTAGRHQRMKMVCSMTAPCIEVRDRGTSFNVAIYGELSATTARAHGAVGALIDGGTRDSGHLIRMGFPVFARYRCPIEAFGRYTLLKTQVPLRISGETTETVQVNPGDFIFGEEDGVIAIPKDLILPVLEECERIAGLEDQARHDFARGDDPVEVFQRYKRF